MTFIDHTSPRLYTVRQFASRHPAFTESSLRWLIFNAKERPSSKGVVLGNGLETALVRIGRRVLLDEQRFFVWVRSENDARKGN